MPMNEKMFFFFYIFWAICMANLFGGIVLFFLWKTWKMIGRSSTTTIKETE